MDQKKLEAAVMEAALTLEAWYHGNLGDRAALRMLRARMGPLGEQMVHESHAQQCSVCGRGEHTGRCGATGCPR
jgi:hypothetical protein